MHFYFLRIGIGVKYSRKLHFSREAHGWHKCAEIFASAKTRRISRLARVHGIDSLREIFGYQETLVMLPPLMFQKCFLEIMKKPGGNYWWRPNTGNMKYGIRVPRNAK